MKEDKVYLFIKKIFDKLKIKISKDNLNLCVQIFKFVIGCRPEQLVHCYILRSKH